MYRLCEALPLYGPVFKDFAHKIFGDGIRETGTGRAPFRPLFPSVPFPLSSAFSSHFGHLCSKERLSNSTVEEKAIPIAIKHP